MHAYAARTSLECTSKTCSDHASSILHAAAACRAFVCRHHTRLSLLASPMAKVGSVYTPGNSQPAPWEDKFKRLLLRFERIQQRHYGMKLMAYTLINLRGFCGV